MVTLPLIAVLHQKKSMARDPFLHKPYIFLIFHGDAAVLMSDRGQLMKDQGAGNKDGSGAHPAKLRVKH